MGGGKKLGNIYEMRIYTYAAGRHAESARGLGKIVA